MPSLAEQGRTDELAVTALKKPGSGAAGTDGRPTWFTNDMLQAAWGYDNTTPSVAISGASGAYCLPAGGVKHSLITTVEVDSKKTAIVAFPGTYVIADVVVDASFATKIIPDGVMPEGTTKKGNGDFKVNVRNSGAQPFHSAALTCWRLQICKGQVCASLFVALQLFYGTLFK